MDRVYGVAADYLVRPPPLMIVVLNGIRASLVPSVFVTRYELLGF